MGVKKRVANRKLADRYAAIELCELSFWIGEHFGGGGCPLATETHHIWGGTSGRHDLESNLIRLCKASHDWVERFKTDGRILCCWVKAEKGELDPLEVVEASGFRLWGWLSEEDVTHEWVKPFLFDLMVGEEFWQAAEAGALDGEVFRARPGFGHWNWLEQAEAVNGDQSSVPCSG